MKMPDRKTKIDAPDPPATAKSPDLEMADALALAEMIQHMAARAGEPDRNALFGIVTSIEARVAGFEVELAKSAHSFADLSRHRDEQFARLTATEKDFGRRLGEVATTIGTKLDKSLVTARDAIETANAGTTARIDNLESREKEVARQFDNIANAHVSLADDIGRLAGRLDDIGLESREKEVARQFDNIANVHASLTDDLGRFTRCLDDIGFEQRTIKEEVGRLARAVDSLSRLNQTLAATIATREAAVCSRFSGLGGIVEALAARVEVLESRKAHPVRVWVSSHFSRVNSWLSSQRA